MIWELTGGAEKSACKCLITDPGLTTWNGIHDFKKIATEDQKIQTDSFELLVAAIC